MAPRTNNALIRRVEDDDGQQSGHRLRVDAAAHRAPEDGEHADGGGDAQHGRNITINAMEPQGAAPERRNELGEGERARREDARQVHHDADLVPAGLQVVEALAGHGEVPAARCRPAEGAVEVEVL